MKAKLIKFADSSPFKGDAKIIKRQETITEMIGKPNITFSKRFKIFDFIIFIYLIS